MSEEGSSQQPGEHVRDVASNISTTHGNSSHLASLKHLVDGDVFQALERHFHMSGKGRRPDLPKDLIVTKKLLLQLFILKEEGQESFKTLKIWLEKLVPNTASVTEGRIKHRVLSILECYKQIPEEEIQQFLESEHNFHELAEPLAALGLTRQHLVNALEFHRLPTLTVANNVVVSLEQFRTQEKLPATFVLKWLKILTTSSANYTDKQFVTKVQSVVKQAKALSKNSKDSDSLKLFLQSDFLQDLQDKPSASESVKSQCKNCVTQTKAVKRLETENGQFKAIIDNLCKQNSIKEDIISVDMKRLREENSSLARCVAKLKTELREVRAKKKEVDYELEKIKTSKLYKKNQQYKKTIHDLKDEKNSTLKVLKQEEIKNSLLERKVVKLKSKVKEEQSLKSHYKTSFNKEQKLSSELRQMLAFDKDSGPSSCVVQLRENGSSHRYSDNIRNTCYALQGEANVPATNCTKVIATVAKHLFEIDLDDKLPCQTTSINFSNEAHLIAKAQVVDEIKKSDHFVYACDGTSRQKATYLEQHIILSNGKQLSLGFSELACEDSETLLNKCVDAFKEIIEIHCLNEEVNEEEQLLKDVIQKMKGLMSDRAAVMKAFDEKMHQFKKNLLGCETASTHFLYCNAHFLLALSSASEEAVKVVEHDIVEEQEKLGRDSNPKFSRFQAPGECATLRAIRLAAESFGPRCDEKSGCRQNWLAFCSSKDKKSMFTSYRANRFNNLFQNATALLYHRDDIVEFLNEFNSHDNLKLQSVLEDISDKRLLANVAVLSFLHVFVTEPYWQLMNSAKSYADFPMYVKKLDAFLCECGHDTYDLRQAPLLSVFEDFPANDLYVNVISGFLQSDHCPIVVFKDCLKKVCDKCVIALRRQLSDFLDGGVFGGEIEASVYEVLKTCPLTNLTGERLFGDFDYCINVRRNASLHLRSTRNMWKHNKTAMFLSKQSRKKKKQLIETAIKYGPVYKQRSVLMKQKLLEIRKAKGAEFKKKKEELALKLLQRKKSVLDAVIARGQSAIIRDVEELDAVFSGPQALQRLREQIRYQNMTKNAKIKITGTKKDLYQRLVQFFSGPSGL